MITYVDMFAGAGGLSEGLTAGGLTGVAHIEADKHAAMTLRTREAYRHLLANKKIRNYRDYLRGKITREQLYAKLPDSTLNAVSQTVISRKTIQSVISLIERNLNDLGATKLDVLAGGPPCQPFSLIGRHKNGDRKYDGRQWLFRHFMSLLEEFRPTVFLFENVPGLFSMRDGRIYESILAEFDNSGYDCEPHVLNSADYGVLQQRKRLIILGWKRRQPVRPLAPPCVVMPGLVGDALADLPALEPGIDASHLGYEKKAAFYLHSAGIRVQGDVLIQHLARPQNERDRQIYRLVAQTWHKQKRRLLCAELPDHLRPTRSVECFRDRFKVVAPDLPHSQTVIAHIACDGHYYIHPDTVQARSITVREAARLQSFPDSYFFEGSRRSVFRQIGNAVPPLLGKAVGCAITEAYEAARMIKIPA